MRDAMRTKSAGLQSLDTAPAGKLRGPSDIRPTLRGSNRNTLARSGLHSGVRDFGPAILLLIAGVLGLAVATLSSSGKSGQYAVIAPPWYTLADTVSLIEQADGRIADIRSNSHVVIVYSERPRFVHDLYRAGAWLVLDPGRLAGCGFVQTQVRKDAV